MNPFTRAPRVLVRGPRAENAGPQVEPKGEAAQSDANRTKQPGEAILPPLDQNRLDAALPPSKED